MPKSQLHPADSESAVGPNSPALLRGEPAPPSPSRCSAVSCADVDQLAVPAAVQSHVCTLASASACPLTLDYWDNPSPYIFKPFHPSIPPVPYSSLKKKTDRHR